MKVDVIGYCPVCGQDGLAYGGGIIWCNAPGCPQNDAISRLIQDQEAHHIVRFTDKGFDILHPLRERINGDLFRCDIHDEVSALDGPPVEAGRYRLRDGEWEFLSL